MEHGASGAAGRPVQLQQSSCPCSRTSACTRSGPPPLLCVLVQGLVVVPQQTAYVVERFGKFWKVLEPGLNLLVPAMHQIRYVYSLKEEALSVPSQVHEPPASRVPARACWPRASG